jgi:carotenoid cleavage dioxygenase-like enzyme
VSRSRGDVASESVFVPRLDSAQEGDGYIIMAHRTFTGTDSYAADRTAGPTYQTPRRA